INVIKSVSEAYFLVLATEEGILVIDSTLQITRKLAEETRLIFQNGFAEETDIDQLDLLIAELEVSKTDAETQLEIAKAYLKFHLGLQKDDKVAPKEQLTDLVENAAINALLSNNFLVNNNIDFQILKNQQELAMLQLKLEKSTYLPELSAFLNYQTQAQRQEWDFFNQQGKWFGSAIFGVNMNIPIFSSGQRASKVKQAQFDYQKTKVAEEELKTSLEIQYETTLNDLRNALENFENTRKNKVIAEKIFRRTGIKYREGMASSLDLLNTHNQFLSSQSQFINASLQVLNMSVSLESLLTSEVEN
ncbi:MAG TPA: TolC family protein, partial [Bacteroidales bacterium]|nr:TolC family protein [Bacteroidales bacterium]